MPHDSHHENDQAESPRAIPRRSTRKLYSITLWKHANTRSVEATGGRQQKCPCDPQQQCSRAHTLMNGSGDACQPKIAQPLALHEAQLLHEGHDPILAARNRERGGGGKTVLEPSVVSSPPTTV